MTEEERLERFRADAYERDAAAVRGVAWSGLGPEPFRPRSPAALRRDTVQRQAALDAWRRSAAGRVLDALVEVERRAEAIRTAFARDPSQDVSRHGQALAQAAREVLRALR
jgi:hypothetical protein